MTGDVTSITMAACIIPERDTTSSLLIPAKCIHNKLNLNHLSFQHVVVAEWLRRWTRNPLGSPRAGSNPADYAFLFSFFHLLSLSMPK